MEMKKLGELCDIVSGGTPSRSKAEFWNEGTIPWIKISNIKGKYVSEADEYITQIGLDNSSAKMLAKGTVLYTIFATLGEVGILEIEACTNQAIAGLAIKDKKQLHTVYLYYYLRSKKWYVNKVGRGVAQNNINMSILKGFEVPLPELSKQIEIVEIIDKVSKIIQKRQQELKCFDNLIKARFIELFGDPIHSDKFDYVKVETCVADKNDMVDGPFGSQVDTKVDYIENGEIPVIRTVNVKMMQFSPLDLKFMTREKYNAVIRSQVLPGDVILTKVGTIGNVCIFPEDYDEAVLSTTGSCRIRVDESKMNKVFFAYNLMYLKPRLLEIASAGVQPFLNMKHVKNIEVFNVPLEQQEQFADFVRQVDKSKVAVQKALDGAQLLFDSLMQKYFG